MKTSSKLRWTVWLADGTTRESDTCTWADVPDGILVVRSWHPHWTVWGDGVYGEPGTWKAAAIVEDAVFARVLAEARA